MKIIVAVGCTLALATAPATAVEGAPATSTACEPGSAVYKVSKGKRAPLVTHVNKVKVAAKKTRTVTKPALSFRTVEAKAIGKGEFDAAAILTGAHAKYLKNEDEVRAPGDRTSTDPADVGEANFRNPTSQPREYAGFQASNVWKGRWTLQHCGDPAVHAKGSWRTFSVIELSGYALCPASRYAAGSASAQACAKTWG